MALDAPWKFYGQDSRDFFKYDVTLDNVTLDYII